MKSSAATLDAPSLDAQRASIWGLSEHDLHEAFWRARGVQCIRPGQEQPIDSAADLYLLIDTHALVLFDISPVLEHLIWRAASLTRLRLNHQTAEGSAYREVVEADESGCVQRIGREYNAVRMYRSINITAKRRLAALWREADDLRSAKHAVRESLNMGDFDRRQTDGMCFDGRNDRECRIFLEQLIARWPDPDRAIEGISKLQEGVWHPDGQEEAGGSIFVGPVWLGHRPAVNGESCLIGPAWRDDAINGQAMDHVPVKLRDMIDIESVNAARDAQARRQHGGYRMSKRAFDIAVSGVLLLLLLPLFAIIAGAILFTTGRPIIYRHERQTLGGRNFDCLKFRTMYQDADQMLAQIGEQNLCDGPQVFIENDPRVTPVGRWLRRFQLDELPQLWHVLRGQMSMVGPRPSPDKENQYCPSWREMRLSVRPGMTGLWQLNRTRQPGQDFQEWIRYDIEYVRNASFWLDLRICFRTAWVVVFGRK